MSLVDRLIEELERDSRARRRIAELLISEPDVRLAIVNAVLADVATKRDIEKLEARIDNRFKGIEERIREIEERVREVDIRMARVEGQLSLFVKLFIAFNLPILLAIIGIFLRMIT